MAKFIDLEDQQDKETPKTKKTYYLLILDKSGSMEGVREQTVSGFNEQVQSLKTAASEYGDQEFFVSLVVFSDADKIDTIYSCEPAHTAKELTVPGYMTGGMTALNDAIFHGIEQLREEADDDEDTRYVVSIFTDGDENSSQKHPGFKGREEVNGFVEELKTTNKWVINYIGATENALKTAKDYGIAVGNTMRYADTPVGTSHAHSVISDSIATYALNRSTGDDMMVNSSITFFSDDGKAVDLTDNTPNAPVNSATTGTDNLKEFFKNASKGKDDGEEPGVSKD